MPEDQSQQPAVRTQDLIRRVYGLPLSPEEQAVFDLTVEQFEEDQ
jgi:hypothetical protein